MCRPDDNLQIIISRLSIFTDGCAGPGPITILPDHDGYSCRLAFWRQLHAQTRIARTGAGARHVRTWADEGKRDWRLRLGQGVGVVQGATVTLDSRAGFAVGLGMTRDIAHDIAFAPELLYVQKGFDQTSGTDEFEVQAQLYRGADTLPCHASPEDRPAPLSPPARQSPSRSACSGEASSGGSSVSQDCSVNDGPNLNSMDFGVIIGAGVGVSQLHLLGAVRCGTRQPREERASRREPEESGMALSRKSCSQVTSNK